MDFLLQIKGQHEKNINYQTGGGFKKQQQTTQTAVLQLSKQKTVVFRVI